MILRFSVYKNYWFTAQLKNAMIKKTTTLSFLAGVFFIFQVSQLFAQAPPSLAQLVQVHAFKENPHLLKVFEYSEKAKAAVLLASIQDEEAKMGRIPQESLEQERTLKKDISFYRQKLAERLDSATEVRFRAKLFEYNRTYDSLIKTFEENYPDYYNLKHNTSVTDVAETQKHLENNEALVSYLRADTVMLIMTVTAKGYDVQAKELDKNFDRYVKGLRTGIQFEEALTFKKSARQLAKILLPDLPKKINRITFIPEGNLGTIPFETLLTEDTKKNEFSDMPYLIRNYTVSYHYSATLWVDARKENIKIRKEGKLQGGGILAVAPVFSDGEDQEVAENTRSLISEVDEQDTIRTRSLLNNLKAISAIPATKSEVDSIEIIFKAKGRKADKLLFSQASEANLKKAKLAEYAFIHLATHGFVNEEKPDLSGILMSQSDSTSEEDGIIFLNEVYNLELNARLVTLSACETGLGKISRGEGIIGLTRALLYAGAQNVQVSLWKVADSSTQGLMLNFYANLLNKKSDEMIAESLREAKLSMINNKSSKFSGPFYWSPFVLIGQ